MGQHILIAGGGIGGLAAALACSRAGWQARLIERAPAFSEVGAGIQLGPNAVKVLHGLGLETALARVAAFPTRLQVRDAVSGRELGSLPLGESALRKYGAPYATVHRSDLHSLLLDAVQVQSQAELSTDTALLGYADSGAAVSVSTTQGQELEGAALIGADGLWSRVRQQMLGDGPPRSTGHLAYRALLRQASLPERLRSQHVTAWLGPKLHVVQYPVRGGEWLNLVLIVQGRVEGDVQSWEQGDNPVPPQAALTLLAGPLRELMQDVTPWGRWALCNRPPISGAQQQATGRVALLGDAAHPMSPYLAQGAGMALEDAAELGRALALHSLDLPARLGRYAQLRWQRNARAQAQSQRNGVIFHAQGALRWGRDASLRLLGQRLLNMPWLYRG